jgi:hypothetical protein
MANRDDWVVPGAGYLARGAFLTNFVMNTIVDGAKDGELLWGAPG